MQQVHPSPHVRYSLLRDDIGQVYPPPNPGYPHPWADPPKSSKCHCCYSEFLRESEAQDVYRRPELRTYREVCILRQELSEFRKVEGERIASLTDKIETLCQRVESLAEKAERMSLARGMVGQDASGFLEGALPQEIPASAAFPREVQPEVSQLNRELYSTSKEAWDRAHGTKTFQQDHAKYERKGDTKESETFGTKRKISSATPLGKKSKLVSSPVTNSGLRATGALKDSTVRSNDLNQDESSTRRSPFVAKPATPGDQLR